jgi:hypothetical protein
MPKSGITVTVDRLAELATQMRVLGSTEVLVGVPEEKAQRKTGDQISNAALAYIHTKGAPEANIHARPFLEPGIKKVQEPIAARMKDAALAVMEGGSAEKGLMAAGQTAASSAQAVIKAGIPPPLKPSTILARRRRGKGSSYRRKAISENQVTPLWDTGQLLRAITFVLRLRKR